MKLQTDVAYLVESKQAFHEIQGELFKRGYKWLTCGNKFKKLQDSDFPRYVSIYDDKLIMTSKKNSFERPVITFNLFSEYDKVYFVIKDGRIAYGYGHDDYNDTIEFHAGDTIYLHEGKLCVNRISKQYPVPEEPVKQSKKVTFVEVPFLEVAERLQNGDSLDDYYIELSRDGLCSLNELDANGVGLKYKHIKECKFFKREE